MIFEVASVGIAASIFIVVHLLANLDTTQASTFFSDATNGTKRRFRDSGLNYNKGLADYHAKHNWVVNFTGTFLARDTKV